MIIIPDKGSTSNIYVLRPTINAGIGYLLYTRRSGRGGIKGTKDVLPTFLINFHPAQPSLQLRSILSLALVKILIDQLVSLGSHLIVSRCGGVLPQQADGLGLFPLAIHSIDNH